MQHEDPMIDRLYFRKQLSFEKFNQTLGRYLNPETS
jgi:hypothetical protein